MIFGENMASNGVKGEMERLIKEVTLMIDNVEKSKFYAEMKRDLNVNVIIQKNIHRIIDSHLHVQVVMYCLGSIEYSFKSQFYLAVILLLKRDFASWIGDVEVHGTAMSSADIAAFQGLGLKVFTVDEKCKRKAQGPTMFFMPDPPCRLIGNLLGANWSASCLNKIILLTISFRGLFPALYVDDRNNLEMMIRLENVLEFTEEVGIKTSYDEMYASLFSGFAWHFFPVDSITDLDMDKLEHCSVLRQRYLKTHQKSEKPSRAITCEVDDEDDAEKLIGEITRSMKFVEISEGDQTSEESNADFHIGDDEKLVGTLVQKLVAKVKRTKKYVETRKFYVRMLKDLENETNQKHISRVLGSYSHVQVVIYALGSVEYLYDSRLQLATILQLKQDLPHWIGSIEIYDPIMSSVDIAVCEQLGVDVLTINEDCKRTVQRPTLFYMPYPHHHLIGNLLGANWSSSCLNKILLLTDPLEEAYNLLPLEDPDNQETLLRLQRILNLTKELDIKFSEEEEEEFRLKLRFTWHFFDVDTNFDTDIDKPEYYWFHMQRYLEAQLAHDTEINTANQLFAQCLCNYRMPRHVRWNLFPLSHGWIKLNIYGISRKGNQQGRFCGVFRDKNGLFLSKYKGDTVVQDDVVAGLEALTFGLKRCKEGNPHTTKLIVESDSVILVQFVNGRLEPDKIAMQWLKRISKLQKDILCAVYHVCEEANEVARGYAMTDG